MKKNKTFCKTFTYYTKLCRIRCLVDDLVKFFELSMFINASCTINILFDEVDRGPRHEKKNILLDTIYIIFSSKLLPMT